MVMIDIIHNPTDRSITMDTYHKYYLGVIDVASRYFVPMGIPDKKPLTVFNALKEWSRIHGPSPGYSLYDLEQLHRDFDSTFWSQEFDRLASEAIIRISYAAPRHEEQNGICEANWRNVRNMAFAFMNNA
jgi:transposase InsO family protein